MKQYIFVWLLPDYTPQIRSFTWEGLVQFVCFDNGFREGDFDKLDALEKDQYYQFRETNLIVFCKEPLINEIEGKL